MKVGNRGKDESLPQEVTRRVLGISGDLNFCSSDYARRYMIGSKVRREYIFVVGFTKMKVLTDREEKIAVSNILGAIDLEGKRIYVAFCSKKILFKNY